MELKSYKDQSSPLEVTLCGGEKLNVKYYVNYLTIPMMAELNKIASEPDVSQFDYNVSQLARMLESADMTQNGKPLPFKAQKDKETALSHLSAQDITKVIISVQGDIESETKNDLTGSVDG